MISKQDTIQELHATIKVKFSDYIPYIQFGAPLLFARMWVPFYKNEPYKIRLFEGVVLATNAIIVDYLVNNEALEDYTLAVLPIISSLAFRSDILGTNYLGKISLALFAPIAVNFAVENYSWQSLIPAISTYFVAKSNNVSNQKAALISTLSTITDFFLKDYEFNHPAAWGAAGGVIANNIVQHYPALTSHQQISPVIVGACAAAGMIVGNFEEIFLEQFFAPTHFGASYNSLSKFIDPEILNLALQRHYIMSAGLQIGLGFYGNYLINNSQKQYKAFARLSDPKNNNHIIPLYEAFCGKAFNFIKIAVLYTITRVIVDTIGVYNKKYLENLLQVSFLDNHILIEDNFIKFSKNDFTVSIYLDDISVIGKDHSIIEKTLFSIAKLNHISELSFKTVVVLMPIVILDSILSIGFEYLSKEAQKYSDQLKKCDSDFQVYTNHAINFANTILQKDGLNYLEQEWAILQECKNKNALMNSLYLEALYISEAFYRNDILLTGLKFLLAFLIKGNELDLEKIFLYIRTLEVTTETILFSTKNEATFKTIDSSVTRLNNLAEYFKSFTNSIAKISYNIDEQNNHVVFENLSFSRGVAEKAMYLNITELTLDFGKAYAVTGGNGKGKSSFTTLLIKIIKNITDPSFVVESGKLTTPSNNIEIIPQKDYIPFNVSLFDLIFYPNKLSNQDKINYEQDVVSLVKELNIFNQQDFSLAQLYNIRNDLDKLSGGQTKKIFMIKPLLTCPKILIMDETFAPLDTKARILVMNKIDNSCLKDSLKLIIWHQDKNEDQSSCVQEPFFDYELHIQNNTIMVGIVGQECQY